MTLHLRRRARRAGICLCTLGFAASAALAAPPAEPDTTGLTSLQKVLLKAKQMGATESAPAQAELTLPAGVRRLTTTPLDEGRCDWSPDGKTLYFDRIENGLRSLAALDLATGAVSLVGGAAREGYSPAASPDGRYLAFVRNLPTLHHKIWILRLADGEEAKLTDDGGPLHENDPVWSQNGGHIYYSVSNNGTPNATPMLIARDGENPQALEQAEGSYLAPQPSPSGDKIAWVLRLGTTAFLRIVDARISALSEDFEFPGYFISRADWLPGERRFVVSYLTLSSPRDGYKLGIADLDSGVLTPWLELPAALDPRVSPDGRQVAFRARVGANYELFLADLP